VTAAGDRVLVTGGAGRLGRTVVAELARVGHEVVSVDRAPATVTGASADYAVDLADAGAAYGIVAATRPRAIVQLAAIAVPFSAPETHIYATNTALAANVCQAAVDLGVERLVVASSPTVVGYGNPDGWTPRYLPIDEDHPTEPWHAYALSKRASEDYALGLARRLGDRATISVFRPGFVIAPEEWSGAPTQSGHTVVERLDRPALGAVSLFNYVDARDAAALVDLLLTAEVPTGSRFFGCAADPLARAPIGELLAEHVPATAPFVGPLTATNPAFSIERARRVLGWTPTRSWRTELTELSPGTDREAERV
jgi:nucleoside-diphosphate-sugar epimerase